MVLFIGSLYSGKHDAAKVYAEASGKTWHDLTVCDDISEFADGAFEELAKCAQTLATQYDVILVTEVGSGLVPMEESDRERREKMGRLTVLLAEQADEVYRVVAGLTKRLK